jgi:hypothetical protein
MAYQINLYNPALLSRRQKFSAATMAWSFVVVFAGSLALFAYERQQSAALAAAVAAADRQATQLREQFAQMSRDSSGLARSKALENEIASMEAALTRRRGLLQDLSTGAGGNPEGFSRFFSALARSRIDGLWLTSIRIAGQPADVVLEGRVTDGKLVPAYIESLHRESAFAGRSVSELRLVAREAAQKPPAGASPVEPSRYVEFSVSVPATPAKAGS